MNFKEQKENIVKPKQKCQPKNPKRIIKILPPGRYVGTEVQEENGEVFDEKMKRLTNEISGQFKKSAEIEKEIIKNLKGLGYEI